MDLQTVIFLGPQGAGKGTQVGLLHKYLEEHDPSRNLLHHDTGREFRSFMEKEGYTTRRVRESINRGELQPDFLPIFLVARDLVENMQADTHILFDGFPRSVGQARAMDSAMDFYKREMVDVINLTLDEEKSIRRLLARGRDDDTETAIKKRLGLYRDTTLPVLDYLSDRDRYSIHKVSGEGTVEEIHHRILTKLSL